MEFTVNGFQWRAPIDIGAVVGSKEDKLQTGDVIMPNISPRNNAKATLIGVAKKKDPKFNESSCVFFDFQDEKNPRRFSIFMVHKETKRILGQEHYVGIA